jgi:hypothetical protein
MKRKQEGFLFWFLIPAVTGMGILTAAATGSIPAPAQHSAVHTQSGPVVASGEPVVSQ